MTHPVAIDALLERTGPGVYVAHEGSPVGASLTREHDRWLLVPWDSGDNDFGCPRVAFRSRTRRRTIETFTTLVNFWRGDYRATQPAESTAE